MMRRCILFFLLLSTTAWATPKTCGKDVNRTGACHGNRVVWCEDSTIHTLECTAGSVCAWNDELGAFDCIEVTEQCTTAIDGVPAVKVPLTGICDQAKNRVLWCQNGEVKSLECNQNTSCGWNDDIEMMDCTDSGCGSVPESGLCNGNTLRWCDEGVIQEKVCTEDESCELDGQTSTWRCVATTESTGARPEDDRGATNAVITPPSYGTDSKPPEVTSSDDTDETAPGCQFSHGAAPGSTILLWLMGLLCVGQRRLRECSVD